MKKIAILGSTGSIGKSTLSVVRHLSDQFEVTALAAGSNLSLILEQIDQFHPKCVALYDEKKALELKKLRPQVEVIPGMEGLKAVATSDAEIIVSAITGAIGLIPTVAAIEAGKTIALANKEVLVCGGEFITALAKKKGVKILPVDSEHSALFQCLNGENPLEIGRLILTASGGPFRSFSDDQLSSITVDNALNHPTWDMGPKVTIDSSTLMNKGLEVIEAHWLFGVDSEKIDVVIHPQSIIHSMIEYRDGSIIAQLSKPDMVLPIQYALTYPKRYPGFMKPFDFTKCSKLEFYQPDTEKFRCLDLAFESLKKGDSYSCYLNASNEVLVDRFVRGEISWVDISNHLEELLSRHKAVQVSSLDDILAVDAKARIDCNEYVIRNRLTC